MTLNDIEKAVYRRTGYADSPATEVVTRIRGFINDRHRRLHGDGVVGRDLVAYRKVHTTFASVADQHEYFLPEVGFAKILHIREITNDIPLEMMSPEWYRRHVPDPAAFTGVPSIWIPFERAAVGFRLNGTTGLWVASEGAGDTRTVNLEVQQLNGRIDRVAVVLSGVTRVSAGVTATVADVLSFTVDSASAASIQLYNASTGGNVVSEIFGSQSQAKYQSIVLVPTPSGVITYNVDAVHALQDMTVATERPYLPEDFHDLLVIGARMDEYERLGDDRYVVAAREWNARRIELIQYLRDHRTYFDNQPPDRQNVRYSRLGPWFPAGT